MRCLEALDTETSAPRSSGRCASGVASVLSTTTCAPAARPAAARAATSQTSSHGLVGVSTHSSVAPSSAARIAPSSLGTKRTSTPRGASCSAAMARAPG